MGYAASSGILIKTSSGFQKVKSLEGTGITFSKSGSKGSLTVTGGGSGIITAFADQGDNRIVTSTASVNEIQGEANLTWNGSNLGVTGSITGTGTIGTTGRIISGVAADGAILDYTDGVDGKPFTVVTGSTVKFSVSDEGAVDGASVTATGAVEGGSLTDGTATVSSGAITGATSIGASGTITGGTLTDGTATITGGALASATTVTASGAITGGTLTDGAFSVNSGAVTGATTIVAGTSITTGTADDGVIVTPTTFKVRASSADKLSVTATGAITSAAAIEGTSLTDGTATLSSGALSSATTVTASGAVTGGSLTDGTATVSSGAISGATTVTASGAITGGSLTDGTATVSSGAITGATDITASGATTTGTAVVGSDTSATDSVIFPLTVTHTSTNTPAAGLGVGIAFKSDYADHAAEAESNEVASIEAVATAVGAGAETFDLVFKNRNGSAPAEKMRITSTGIVKNLTEMRAGTTIGVGGGGAYTGTGTIIKDDGITLVTSDSNKFLVSSTGAVTSAAAVQGLSLTDGSATITGGSLTGATNVTAAGTVSGAAVTASGTVTGGTLTDGAFSVNSGAISGATTITASGLLSLTTTGSGLLMPDGQGGIGRIPLIDQLPNTPDSGNSALIDLFARTMGGAVFTAPDDTARIYTVGFQKFDDNSIFDDHGVPYVHSVDCTASENLGRQTMLIAKGGLITVRNTFIDEGGPQLPDPGITSPVYTVGTFNLNGTLNTNGFTLAANKACTMIISSSNGGNGSKAMVHVFGDVTGL
tara:strand:+ start:636 stop:2945 length:2310 start_codon:yes stop_codon:yes gene_type:complete